MTNSTYTEHRWIKHFLGGAVTLICLVIIARQVNVGDILNALKDFKWPYLVLAVTSLSFGYALRIFRWSIMLTATGTPTTWWNCAAPFLGSIALNNVMPLRLGDIVRAFVFPAEMGIRKTTAMSSLVMERLIDLITLLACLSISLVTVQKANTPNIMPEPVYALAILGGVTLLLVFLFSSQLEHTFERLSQAKGIFKGRMRLSKALMVASHFLHSFGAMSRPRVLFVIFCISILVWVGEAGLFYFLLVGFDFEASPVLAIMIMAMVTLSTLVPSSPGYVGPFHLAAFTAISMLGGDVSEAGSYAVLSHLSVWLPTTLLGTIAILMRPALFQTVKLRANLSINKN